MKHPDPPSDKDIQEAFLALDGTIPDGHLDEFSSRVLARLDEPEVSGMDSRELARGSGLNRPDEGALGAAAATSEAIVTPAREENSGLHEIKALASTTKRRISQRVSSEAEKEESLLVGASSGSFRAAAALPDPAAAAGDPASVRVGRPVLARPASEVDRRPMPTRSSSVPFWVLGGVATAAAAAAVAVFVFGVGREKKDQDLASRAGSGEVVARATGTATPSDPALAEGGAAAGDMKFAEPPPAEQAPAAPGAAPASTAVSSPAVAALDEPQKKAEERGLSGDDVGGKGGGGLAGRTDSGAKDGAADKGDPARTRREVSKESKKAKPQQGKAPGEGGKDLNDVLDEVTGGVKSPTAPVEEAGPKKPSKKGLDRSDVAKAMGAVRSQVMRCRDKENYEGSVTVKFQVAPSGAVTSAEATGGKAGSSTGACVAAAVKKAVFPPFDGATTSFTYPFLLAE